MRKNETKKTLLKWGSCLSLVALGLSACGSDQAVPAGADSGKNSASSATEELSGNLIGAGASSQKSAVEAWIAGYNQLQTKVQASYDPVGSGAGVTQFLQGAVQFAGSDEALGEEETSQSSSVCKQGNAINLPVYISPVAVVFNLPKIEQLNLKPEVIARIFQGTIKRWNDEQIKADNPQTELPDLPIVPVHRADASGTTENFTEYLHTAAPSDWSHAPSKEWPISGGESGDKTAGVKQSISASEGTIGYLDASQAGDLGKAALPADGKFITYSAEAAAKTVEQAELANKTEQFRSSDDFALKLDRSGKTPQAYPLVLVSYYVVCPQYQKPEQGKLVKSFLSYVISEDGQQKAAQAAGSAPLTSEIQQQLAGVVDKIK